MKKKSEEKTEKQDKPFSKFYQKKPVDRFYTKEEEAELIAEHEQMLEKKAKKKLEKTENKPEDKTIPEGKNYSKNYKNKKPEQSNEGRFNPKFSDNSNKFKKKDGRPNTENVKSDAHKERGTFKKKFDSNAPKKHSPKVEETSIPNTEAENPENMRLNKYIAHAGICSRRKADEHIANGLVTVNGQVVLEMGYKVQKDDVIEFQGKKLEPKRDFVYVLMNKPKNFITTVQDENDRRTVMELVKEFTDERVYPVGRLDRNTTGLLLMTNDGALAQKLSHPSFELKKVYRVTLNNAISEEEVALIRNTLVLEDGAAPVDAIEYGDNFNVVILELHIGRNRIVRRIFEHLGYEVMKLDRIRYGSLTKKNLPVGSCRHLTKQEIIILKHLA